MADHHAIVILTGLWLLLIGAWWLTQQVAARHERCDSIACRLLLTGEVFFAMLTAIGLLLGSFHLFRSVPAALAATLAAVGMFIAGGALWFRARRSSGDPPNGKPKPGVSSDVGLPFGGSSARRLPRARGRRLAETVLLLLLVALCAIVAVRSLADPTYEYDALTYHLVFPAKWVQDGAISIVPTWFGDPAPAYAPSNTEVYYAWLMLATGDDRLARGGQFAFWLVLLLAAYVLGGELRLRRVERLGACLALALIPAINAQASTAMVDVAFAAQLVAVAAFALRTGRTRSAADAVGLMLACGLLLGMKFIALPYLAAMSPLIVWALYRTVPPGGRGSCRAVWVWHRLPAGVRGHRQDAGATQGGRGSCRAAGVTPDPGLPFGGSRRGRRIALAGALVLACLIGGFWCVRNWAVTGNPVYPLEVKLSSTIVFPGAYGRAQMENSVFNVRRETDPDAFGRTLWEAVHAPQAPEPPTSEQGYVPAFRRWYVGPLGLIAAGWLLAMIAALRPSPRRTPRLLLFVGTALAFVVFWYVLPFQQPRFAWGPLALAVVGATAVTRLHPRAALIVTVLAALAWIGLFWADWRLIAIVSVRGCLGTAALVVMFLIWRLIPRAKTRGKPAVGFWRQRRQPSLSQFAAIAAVCIGLAVVVTSWAADAPRSRAMAQPRWRFFRDAWTWVDENLHGVTIAYAGNNVPYFLYGPRLENHVVYVPARRPPGGRYHDFAQLPETLALGPPSVSEAACDRYVMDPSVWLDNLRALGVRYVLVSSLFPNLLPTHRHDQQGFPIEREWLDALGDASSESEHPFVERRVFGGGSVLLYELHWEAPLPSDLLLRRIAQDESGRPLAAPATEHGILFPTETAGPHR
jgi:hypothetical protein